MVSSHKTERIESKGEIHTKQSPWVETGAFPWRVGGGKFCLRFSVQCAFAHATCHCFNSGTLPCTGRWWSKSCRVTRMQPYIRSMLWALLATAIPRVLNYGAAFIHDSRLESKQISCDEIIFLNAPTIVCVTEWPGTIFHNQIYFACCC